MLVVLIDFDALGITRTDTVRALTEKRIGTQVHYIPVHMQSYYTVKYGWKPLDFPIAKQLSETVISLPLYPALQDREVNYILDNIKELWALYSI